MQEDQNTAEHFQKQILLLDYHYRSYILML